MRAGTTATPARARAPAGVAAQARRNMLLLAAGMAALYGMVELASAVGTLTFVAAGGPRALNGLAPAVFLGCAALTALPAGRSMDRFGRAPVLRAGFAAGICGCLLAALGASARLLPAVVLGFVLVGASIGTVMLSRAAAADMVAPERRAHAISLVLFGAVFGALLGPVVFIPLVSSGGLEASTLAPAWIGAAGFMLAGLAIAGAIRPDPGVIARAIAAPAPETAPAAPVREIIRRPGVPVLLGGAVASWSVMVALMTLMGPALIAHDHARTAIFPVLSAHFVGMFALFPLVGLAVGRLGGRRGLAAGLVLLAASALALPAALGSVALSALALFGAGLGWSLAYVSATTALLEVAGNAGRGALLGVSDLLAGLCGAALTVLAGYALASAGVALLATGGALIALAALAPAVRRPRPAP